VISSALLSDHATVIGDLQKTVATQQMTIQDQKTTIQDQQVMLQDQNRLIQLIQTELRAGRESTKEHSVLLQVILRDIRNVNQMFEETTAKDDSVKELQTDEGVDNMIRQTNTDPGMKPLTRRQGMYTTKEIKRVLKYITVTLRSKSVCHTITFFNYL